MVNTFSTNKPWQKLPHLHETIVSARRKDRFVARIPSNTVHIAVVDLLLELMHKLPLSNLREEMNRVIASRREHTRFIPVDRVERLVVVAVAQNDLWRHVAVSNIVYTSSPQFMPTIPFLPVDDASVHSARDELRLLKRTIG